MRHVPHRNKNTDPRCWSLITTESAIFSVDQRPGDEKAYSAQHLSPDFISGLMLRTLISDNPSVRDQR
jgi:hypothetical protein